MRELVIELFLLLKSLYTDTIVTNSVHTRAHRKHRNSTNSNVRAGAEKRLNCQQKQHEGKMKIGLACGNQESLKSKGDKNTKKNLRSHKATNLHISNSKK
jgi:hypothetical protein